MKEDLKETLLLLGMHRSGTSLLAKWLHHCGLFMGHRLLGKNEGNPGGHFEDLDFLAFHNDLLEFNKTTPLGETHPTNFIVEPYHLQRASALATFKSKLKSHWAWKDPRTCLFLNTVWRDVLPNSKAIIIFRDYKAVVHSLIRRDIQFLSEEFDKMSHLFGSLRFLANPLIQVRLHFYRKHYQRQLDYKIRLYLQNWIWHHKELKEFLENRRDTSSYIIIAYERLADCQDQLIQYLQKEWSFPLRHYPISDVQLKSTARPIAELANRSWPADLEKQAEQLLGYFRQHPQKLKHGV